MDIKAHLKKLIADSRQSVSAIALKAGVPYHPLQRFMKGQTVSYDVDSANRVHHYLTGKWLVKKEAA